MAAKLRGIVPWLVNNHCVANRLTLACSQAADAIPYRRVGGGGSKGSNEPPLKFDNGGLKYK